MLLIEPNTNIRIIKSPIELDNLNQLTFSSKQAQENYFKSLPYLEMDDSSYQRKDGYIRFEGSFDEIIKYNYCMYQNEGYSDKWFYAFITNVEYLSDESCSVYIETDCFQTWQFDIIYKASFIEREMLSTTDDIVGANTQPEGLELGEYVNCKTPDVIYNDPRNSYICMGVSDVPYSGAGTPGNNRIYNGIYSGLYYLFFSDATECGKVISMYDKAGKKDAIYSLFMTVDDMELDTQTITWTHDGITATVKILTSTPFANELTPFYGVIPSKLGNNYTPKNKKLFTFPYSFMTLSNSSGSCKYYQYEHFADPTAMKFIINSTITPGMSIKAYPVNYKNSADYYDEGVVAGKLPVCSWDSDCYTNWLTQNSLNNAIGVGGSVLQIVGGALLSSTGAGALAGAGQIASGIFGIANSVSQFYQHSLVPDQVQGNINSGDSNFSSLECGLFTFNYISIKDQYAKVIDDYFSMYGYKTNLVKLPNLNNRSNWNYVKTINCNLLGDLPQKDLQKIKDLFNNGITLWHNPETFLDYSQTNS